jgi:hypothetical protein
MFRPILFFMEEKRLQNLRYIHKHIKSVSVEKGGKRYEGVPISENWMAFDDFVKDNWFRYYRSIIKWKNYTGLTKDILIHSKVRFIRKVRGFGFTKDNTVFTSPSDAMKYYSTTHKYMFEDKLLGTRDIYNILKKRGININMSTVTERLRNGQDLFAPANQEYVKWKGRFRSFAEIAKLENVAHGTLKQLFYRKKNIGKAVDAARNVKRKQTYLFEGRELTKREICSIIAKRKGLKLATVEARFKSHGMNIAKLQSKEHSNFKHGKYKTKGSVETPPGLV